MRKCEISIIIPVYNTGKYLKRCIESVLAQTYQDFEVILVNDGSTDNSAVICNGYAARYEHISVIHNSNQGPAASREEGVKRAGGNFIMFVDSDDWLHEKILEILYANIRQTKVNMVCCNYKDIYPNKEKAYPCMIAGEYLDCLTPAKTMEQIHKTRNLAAGPIAKLYKKQLFEKVNFCKEVTIGEDYAMFVQLAEKAKKIRILKEVLYYRRMRSDNLSHSGYTKRHKGALYNYLRIRRALIKKYPELKKEIIGYHTEYEMAVITAMCRSNIYDKKVINRLKKDLREHLGMTWSNQKIPFYMKVCAAMIAYTVPVFILLFRIIHGLTGR